MKGLLLIGGMATRLLPLSRYLAKPLLPVCDRELLHYQVGQLARAGIGEIILAAGHQVEQIEAFASLYSGGLQFVTSFEDEPLGTAGAIAHAREYLDGDPLIVLNADILSSLELADVLKTHREAGRVATVVGREVEDPSRFGLLKTRDGLLTAFLEKPAGSLGLGPHYINAGIYVLEPEAVAAIPAGRKVSIERETFPLLIERHGALGFHRLDGLWADIGTFESWFSANFALLAQRFAVGETTLWGKRDDCAVFKDLVYINKGARLGRGVTLYHRVIVMKDAQIGGDCRLQNCILMPGARVGEGARLTDCIVGPGAEVGAGERLQSLLLVAGEEHVPFFPGAREAP